MIQGEELKVCAVGRPPDEAEEAKCCRLAELCLIRKVERLEANGEPAPGLRSEGDSRGELIMIIISTHDYGNGRCLWGGPE